jgi:hypothetical protein
LSCGFFDCLSIQDPLYNFVVAVADSASVGIGPLLRKEYDIAGPNTCSSSYKNGQIAGFLGGIVTSENEAEAVVLTRSKRSISLDLLRDYRRPWSR